MRAVCSPLSKKIYCGNVRNNMWVGKKYEITESAIDAVAQHLIENDISVVFEYKGKEYILKVEG